MRKFLFIISILLPTLCLAQQTYHILPQPKQISYGKGSYSLPKGWNISKAKWQKDTSLPEEAYRLAITEKGSEVQIYIYWPEEKSGENKWYIGIKM